MSQIPAVLMPVEDALSRLLDSMRPFSAVQDLVLGETRGQYLASDVAARVDVPAFDNAAVDGVALRYQDLAEPGLTLPMPLRVAAGDPPCTLMPGAHWRRHGVDAGRLRDRRWPGAVARQG